MKIIKYTKKSANKYNILLENQESISLYSDLILKYNLLILKEIDKNTLEAIKKDNLKLELYYKTLKYLKSIKCTKDVKEYLKAYDSSLSNYVIDRLKKERYLDDNNYIKAYINTKVLLSNDGYYKIYNYLQNKDLDKISIKEDLDLITDDTWLEKIKRIVNTKLKTNSKDSKNMVIMKLKNYLKNLGYPDYLINQVLITIKVDNSKEEANLKKEYTKLYNKYKNKYDSKKLNYILVGKLLKKGYNLEKVKALVGASDL